MFLTTVAVPHATIRFFIYLFLGIHLQTKCNKELLKVCHTGVPLIPLLLALHAFHMHTLSVQSRHHSDNRT